MGTLTETRNRLVRDAMFRNGARGHVADQVAAAILVIGYPAALAKAVRGLRPFSPSRRESRARVVARNFGLPVEWVVALIDAEPEEV